MPPVARLLTLGLLAAALLSPAPASADEPKAAPPANAGVPPTTPAAVGAPLALSVTHRGPTMPWQVEVKNTSTEPVLVAADPRLLWLEVKVPGKKAVQTCRLPEEVFPNRPDPATHLVLAPGESATQRFDPRLYCFGAAGQTELVPGAYVTPRFGWPEATKVKWVNGRKVEEVLDQPPFVGRTVDAATAAALAKDPKAPHPEDAKAPHAKVLRGDGFALGSEYAAWSRSRLPQPGDENAPLQLRLKQGSDAEAERMATVQLAVENRGTEARFLYFRRELVSFEVAGPTGLAQCDPEPDQRSPDRQAFERLAPGQSVSVYNRLVELCPRGTFGTPGLYLVHARFDSEQDGAEFDLDAFVGRIATVTPVGVRIRKGDKPPPKRMEHVTVAP